MSLHLITGRANSGKSGRAFGLIREAVEHGHEPWLLLPTQQDVSRAQRELSSDTPLGVRVGTFASLIHEGWDRDGDGRSIVTGQQRSLLLGKLGKYHGMTPSTAALAGRCIRQLSEHTGARWREPLKTPDPVCGPLASVIGAYGRELDRLGLIEGTEAAWLLASQGHRPADVVVAHRFSDFTHAQISYLRAVSRTGDVWVTLVWESGHQATHSAQRVIDVFGPSQVEHIAGEPFNTATSLAVVEKNLFGVADPAVRDGAVRLVLGEGEEAHAELLAQEAKCALNEGTAGEFGDIAVVLRRPETHFYHLKRAFSNAGVPAQFHGSVPVKAVPFGAAVLDTMDFALESNRASLERLARSPFRGGPECHGRNLELMWRRRGDFDAPKLLADLRDTLPALHGVIQTVRSAAHGPLTAEMCAILAESYQSLFAMGFSDCEADETASSAYSAIMDLLSDAAALSGADIDLSAVRRTLLQASVRISGPERRDAVQVVSAMSVRGQRFGTVLMGGLNEGEFPAGADESISPAGAVGAMLEANGVPLHDGDAVAAAERLLFYECVTRARNRLVLCARATDSDSEALARSPFWDEVAGLFDAEGEGDQLLDVYRGLADGSSSVRCEAENADESSALAERSVRASRRAARRPSLTLMTPAGSAFDKPDVSPSEIEAWLRCPYRWFLDYAMRPSELDREYGPRDEGDMAHELLARTYGALKDQDCLPLNPAKQEMVEKAMAQVLASLRDKAVQPAPLVERMGKAHAERAARRIVAEDMAAGTRFVPSHFEWAFDAANSAVMISGVALHGRVDRVDVDGSGNAVVVDYKRTVGPTIQAAKLLAHGHVQGLLYLEVIRRSKGLTPVGALYRGLARPGLRGAMASELDYGHKLTKTDRVDLAQVDEMIAAALLSAERAVAGMRAGDIPPLPVAPGACLGCRAASRCEKRLQ